MASYLTPEWLMQDIGQLLSTTRTDTLRGTDNPLTKEEFEGEYQTPWGDEETEFYYDYGRVGAGFGDEYSDKNSGMTWGYKFGSEDEAYEAYLNSLPAGLGPDREVNIFDREALVEDIEYAQAGRTTPRGVGGQDPKAFTAFTPEMFKKLRTEHYQPELEEKRGALIDKLIGKQRLAKAEGGGFAGYGGRERASQQLGESYRGGVEDIYTGIEKQKASGLQNIYDVMSQYEAIE